MGHHSGSWGSDQERINASERKAAKNMDCLMIRLAMKHTSFKLWVALYCFNSCFAQEVRPQEFQRGVISSQAVEFCPTFSIQLDEVYFTRSFGQWGKGELSSSIYYSREKEGRWTQPVLASFSGEYHDSGQATGVADGGESDHRSRRLHSPDPGSATLIARPCPGCGHRLQ